MSHYTRLVYWTAICLGILLGTLDQVLAYGGVFEGTTSVVQDNIRVLFVKGEEEVTVHIKPDYTGDPKDFSWILPVPALPTIQPSHNRIFRFLESFTQPTFNGNYPSLETIEDQREFGNCGNVSILELISPHFLDYFGGVGDPDIAIMYLKEVGPYAIAIIKAGDAGSVRDWLKNNNYQINRVGDDLLQSYIDSGSYFIALKFSADIGGTSYGDIQPIAFTYAADDLVIPLRLTTLASKPENLLTVWILGKHRAIPTNYLHVHINQARLAWTNPYANKNYIALVAEAVQEAGGQAFVTDYAGPSNILANRFYRENQYDLEALRALESPANFVRQLVFQGFTVRLNLQGFPIPTDLKIVNLLRKHIPFPQAIIEDGAVPENDYPDAETQFYSWMDRFEQYTADVDYDLNGFVDDLEAQWVAPLRTTQQLFDKYPYLTRLYTIFSPEQIAQDPMFSFNPSLPEQNQHHQATIRFECPEKDPDEITPNEIINEIIAEVTLENNHTFRYLPFGIGFEEVWLEPQNFQSAASRIEQLKESGPPIIIQTETIVSEEKTNVSLPSNFTLLPNYPNPFNSSTILPFQVPDSISEVTIQIYNTLGQPIRTILMESDQLIRQSVVWDGLDAAGNPVASGVYIYSLESGSIRLSRKLVLLR